MTTVKTEAAFTPAPWGYTVRPNGTMVVLTREPSGGARKHIAEMSWADSENAEANAHLIAAAPEMYDTLEKLRADLAEEDAERHAQRIAVIDLTINEARGDAPSSKGLMDG